MPYLGLGTYESDNDQEVVDAVKSALAVGYRHIDTASAYKDGRRWTRHSAKRGRCVRIFL